MSRDDLAAFDTKGYRILKSPFQSKELDAVLGYIQPTTIRYDQMTTFIQDTILKSVNKAMGPDWDVVATKYRVSDNNNSDAAAFHRDSINMKEWVPAMTCVVYLDPTVMEVVPGSHRIQTTSFSDAVSKYGTREQLSLERGDILFFYGSMLHRGLLDASASHRRIIQIFDIFRTPDEYRRYSPRLVHIPSDDTHNELMTTLAKTPGIGGSMNWIGYLNAMTGYGGNSSIYVFEKAGLPNASVFCSEGFRPRITVQTGTDQPINMYVFLQNIHTDLPSEYRNDWRWALYTRQMLLYTVLHLLLIGITAWVLYVGVRRLITRGSSRTRPRTLGLRGRTRR